MMTRIVRTALVNLAVFLVLLIAAGVGAEFFLRATGTADFALAWPGTVLPDVGTVFQPHAIVRHTDNIDFATEQTSNSLGFLDREPPALAPEDCRIAFIGDSFVEAVQVPLKDKFHVLVEGMLSDIHVRTMAFGYSGTGQINQLPYYDRYAAALKPRVVVLVVVDNDITNNSAILESLRNGWHPLHLPRLFARDHNGTISLQPVDPDYGRYALPVPPTAPPSTRRAIHQSLYDNVKTYRAIFTAAERRYPAITASLSDRPSPINLVAYRRHLLESDPAAADLLAGWPEGADSEGLDLDFEYYKPGPLPAPFEQGLRFTDFAFAQWAERARRDQVKLLALTTQTLTLLNERYLERIRSILRRHGIAEIDQNAYGSRHGQTYLSDALADGHWSPKGHRHVAEMVAEYFREHQDLCRADPM